MATSKTPNTPKIDDDFLAGIKNADDTNGKTTSFETRQDRQTVEPAKTSTPATSDKKVLYNFKINESLLQDLRNYCESNYMTVTAGITKAINDMLKDGK